MGRLKKGESEYIAKKIEEICNSLNIPYEMGKMGYIAIINIDREMVRITRENWTFLKILKHLSEGKSCFCKKEPKIEDTDILLVAKKVYSLKGLCVDIEYSEYKKINLRLICKDIDIYIRNLTKTRIINVLQYIANI